MAGDRFGVAVGITEGYAVVGAEWHTGPGGTGCGAAYVFTLNGTWTQEASVSLYIIWPPYRTSI